MQLYTNMTGVCYIDEIVYFTCVCSAVKDPHLISLVTKLTGLLLQIEVYTWKYMCIAY